jgi:hypothetical protein
MTGILYSSEAEAKKCIRQILKKTGMAYGKALILWDLKKEHILK